VNLVVDSNILVSCLIKADGRTAGLYINPPVPLVFHAPERIMAELSLHRGKFMKITGASPGRHAELEEVLLSMLTIVPDARIADAHWEHAFHLVKDIDENDLQFVALALHLGCPLWTGDLRLVRGLRRKGFKGVITNEELRRMVEQG
jgi:predicted nucleic acid-binding protein